MTPLAFVISVAPGWQSVDVPTLEYYQDHFVVRKGRDGWRVPVRPPAPRPVLAVSFRRNRNYAVWDERGLTVRRGDKFLTTLLPDTVTSPKLFSRPELLKTIELLNTGARMRNASALSGALRVGTNAYFLVRWEEKGKGPWLEALFQVDLAGEEMKPKLLGRFSGLSVAFRPIDDRLFISAGIPSVVTRRANDWGVAAFNPRTQKFAFRRLGTRLTSLMPLARTRALFVEQTAYGTTLGGEIDLDSGVRRERFESRGNARFIDSEQPWVMVTSRAPSAQLRNGETGSETTIPAGSGVVRAGPLVVVFTPYSAPTSATLYEPERWTELAKWTRKP